MTWINGALTFMITCSNNSSVLLFGWRWSEGGLTWLALRAARPWVWMGQILEKKRLNKSIKWSKGVPFFNIPICVFGPPLVNMYTFIYFINFWKLLWGCKLFTRKKIISSSSSSSSVRDFFCRVPNETLEYNSFFWCIDVVLDMVDFNFSRDTICYNHCCVFVSNSAIVVWV